MHITYNVTEDCINLKDSYGVICVKCNACGRFNKDTQKECALKMYERQLSEEQNFNRWIEGVEELQRKNIKKNILYIKKKIKELKEE